MLLPHAPTVVLENLALARSETVFTLTVQFVQNPVRLFVEVLVMRFRIVDLQARLRFQ